MDTTLNDDRWNEIANDVLCGNVILFLGPGATVNFERSGRQETFFRDLALREPSRVSAFHEQDGFLVFRPKGRNRLSPQISDFYRQIEKNELLQLLADIPFNLLISLTPDNALQTVFEENSFAFTAAYNDRTPAHALERPTPVNPLIYNLLGSAAAGQESSLVVSHGDLFDLIESIHLRESLPATVLSAFSLQRDHSKTIIFLGIDYDKWYFHFLIHLFKMSGEMSPVAAAGKQPIYYQQALYEAHFKMTFVSEGLMEFATALHQRIPHQHLRSSIFGNRNRMRKALQEGLNDQELMSLCTIHFPNVQREFTLGQLTSQRIDLLLDEVDDLGKWDFLMSLLQEENPAKYTQYFPANEH